jgi:hypothetical protein
LSAEASAELRRRLASEIDGLDNVEVLATWAHRALPLKNQLTKADAQAIEDAFTAMLSQLEGLEPVAPNHEGANDCSDQSVQAGLSEQTVIVIRKPIRERDREHLKFVASQPCLICGRTPSDAHHIKFAEQRGIARKVSDRFTVPACRLHHRELHRQGNERIWWERQGIDPLVIAATLWDRTHAVVPKSDSIADDPPTTTSGRFNGRQFRSRVGDARLPQNNETKPILRSEAE